MAASIAKARNKRPRAHDSPFTFLDIPGVPLDVSTQLYQAIAAATRLFETHSGVVVSPASDHEVTEESQPQLQAQPPLSALKSIFQRLESSAASTTDELRNDRVRQQLKNSVSSWLKATHLALRNETIPDKKTKLVTLLLEFLWTSQPTNKGGDLPSLAQRRASLHMVGHLLQRSADARCWLLNNARLLGWINTISHDKAQSQFSPQHPPLVCWQKECALVLQYLHSDGYSDFYPVLPVALERLRQSCPCVRLSENGDLDVSLGDSNHSMITWRTLRDELIRCAETKVAKIEERLNFACFYLDKLVPRFGSAIDHAKHLRNCTSSVYETLDDDNSINWEDGDVGLPVMTESHSRAVETTLTIMKETGTFKNGFDLEIDFNFNAIPQSSEAAHLKPTDLRRLAKTVHFLREKDLHRLSLWVEGLTYADTLTGYSKFGLDAFVTLPSEVARKRESLLCELQRLKSRVLKVVQVADQLEARKVAQPVVARHVKCSDNKSSNGSQLRNKHNFVERRLCPDLKWNMGEHIVAGRLRGQERFK